MKLFVPSNYQEQIVQKIHAVTEGSSYSLDYHKHDKFQSLLQHFSAEKANYNLGNKQSNKNLQKAKQVYNQRNNKFKLPSIQENNSIQQIVSIEDGSFIQSINDQVNMGNPNDILFSRNESFFDEDFIKQMQKNPSIEDSSDVINVQQQVSKLWSNHDLANEILQIDMPVKQRKKFNLSNKNKNGMGIFDSLDYSIQNIKTEEDYPNNINNSHHQNNQKINSLRNAFQLPNVAKHRQKIPDFFKYLQEMETKEYLSVLSRFLSNVYHKQKSVKLERFQFNQEAIISYLQHRYSSNLINKLFVFLGFGHYFDIKSYLSTIKKFQYFELNHLLFLSFHLLDENNDGYICLNDLFQLLKMKTNYMAQKEFHVLEKLLQDSFKQIIQGKLDNSQITYKEIYKFQEITFKDYYKASHPFASKKFSVKKITTALNSSFNPYSFDQEENKRNLRKKQHELNPKYSALFGNIDKCKVNFEIYKNAFNNSNQEYKTYFLMDVIAHVCCLMKEDINYGYTREELINNQF